MLKALARSGEKKVHIVVINRPIDFLITPWKHYGKFIRWLKGISRNQKIYSNLTVYTPLLPLHDLLSFRIPIHYHFQI